MGVLPSMSAHTDGMGVSLEDKTSHTRITMVFGGFLMIIIGFLGVFVETIIGFTNTTFGYMVLALFYIVTGSLAIHSSKKRIKALFVITLVFSIITIIIAIVIRLKFGAGYDRIKEINRTRISQRRYYNGPQMAITRVNAIFFQGAHFTYKSNTSIYITSIMASIELIGALLSMIQAAMSCS